MYKMVFVILLVLLLVPICYRFLDRLIARFERMTSEKETSEEVVGRVREKISQLENEAEEIRRSSERNDSQKDVIEKFLAEKNENNNEK